MSEQRTYQIVAALIRREDEVLLVQEQGPDDPGAVWALPGGVVEAGELLNEALAREVREETGLEVRDPGRLIYVAQMHNPIDPVRSPGEGPASGSRTTTFVFEVNVWSGEPCAQDPDRLVSTVAFVPPADAIGKLDRLPLRVMREPIVAYLRGEVECGAVWLYRKRTDGKDELVMRVGG